MLNFILDYGVLILIFVALFVLGAIAGSFLNVWIARLPLDKSVFWPTHSRCGNCLQTIRWYDNLPILSYWILGGRCRNCVERRTDVCLNVNDHPGGAYGYVDMGGWRGGQAEFVMVPYADWNTLKYTDKDQALAKMLDLTMITDILPTGFHGCVEAKVGAGSTVYIGGGGPVGLAAATSAQFLGASVVVVGDPNEQRRKHAREVGFEVVDPLAGALPDQIEQLLGVPEVDAAVDCVGFEAKGHRDGTEQNAAVLNQAMEVTRAAGAIGIPGLYVTEDPGAADQAARHGTVALSLGIGWAKSLSFATGQTPTMQYNRALREAILHDRVPIARNVNATVIPLDDAPEGYQEFDAGAPKKFVLDPHGMLGR